MSRAACLAPEFDRRTEVSPHEMHYLPPVVQALLFLLVIVAAVIDLRERRIPNWLTAGGVVMGIALNSFLYESAGFWMSLAGIGAALLVYMPLFLIRAMGAGDAKLMAAVGAMTGFANWLGIFVISSVLGGLVALVLLFCTGQMRRTFTNTGILVSEIVRLRPPYLHRSELDVGSDTALTLPHGATVALGVTTFLAAAAVWAPR